MNEIDFINQIVSNFEGFDYTVTSEYFDGETGDCGIAIAIGDGIDHTIGSLSIDGYFDEIRSNEGEITVRYIIEAKLEGDIKKIISLEEHDMKHLSSKSA